MVFEKAAPGRDKVCGDGLTPRAVSALRDLDISLEGAHRTDGLRMIAGNSRRELQWPANNRFGPHGAVWPRRLLDKHLVDAASQAGAEIAWNTEVLPALDSNGPQRAYLHHLFRIGDSAAERLATRHNLRFYAWLMEQMRCNGTDV